MAGGVGMAAVWLGACGGDADDTTAPASATATESSATTASGCVLTPEQTEGPYWVANELTRRDVTDGRPGVPLDLRMTVQEAGSCNPIEGTDVEIWHSDAGGAYSGVEPGDDSLFLRGHQKSDAAGEVRFDTIYPGWYMGRTTHIHVKVHAGGDTVHTGQLYFDDAVSAAVYATDAYASRGGADTTNATDGIYASGGAESTLDLRKLSGGGYRGTIALRVRT